MFYSDSASDITSESDFDSYSVGDSQEVHTNSPKLIFKKLNDNELKKQIIVGNKNIPIKQQLLDVPADGNCFYTALIVQLTLPAINSNTDFYERVKLLWPKVNLTELKSLKKELKKYYLKCTDKHMSLEQTPFLSSCVLSLKDLAVDYIFENLQSYYDFIEEETEKNKLIKIQRHLEPKEWADNSVINAISKMLDCEIIIYYYEPEEKKFTIQKGTEDINLDIKYKHQIILAHVNAKSPYLYDERNCPRNHYQCFFPQENNLQINFLQNHNPQIIEEDQFIKMGNNFSSKFEEDVLILEPRKKSISEKEYQDYSCFFYKNVASHKLKYISQYGYIVEEDADIINLKCETWINKREKQNEKYKILSEKKFDNNKAEIDIEKIKKSGSYGWKIHISIDDSDRNNIETAWDCLVPVLIKYGIYYVKFYKSNFTNDDKWCEKEENLWNIGKRFTIYALHNLPKTKEFIELFESEKSVESATNSLISWNDFFNEVAETLKKNNIKPGYLNPACRAINNYISYRNDKNPEYFNNYLIDNEKINPNSASSTINSTHIRPIFVPKLTIEQMNKAKKDPQKIKPYISCDEVYKKTKQNKEKSYNFFQENDPFENISIEKIETKSIPEYNAQNNGNNENCCCRNFCCNIL